VKPVETKPSELLTSLPITLLKDVKPKAAMVVAFLVYQVSVDCQAKMVAQDDQVTQVSQALQANLRMSAPPQAHHHANHAHQAHQDQQEAQVPQVTQDQLAQMARTVNLAKMVQKDHQAHQAQPDQMVKTDPKVTTVPQLQMNQAHQVKPDPTATTDHQAHQAQPDHQAQMATTETQDPKDPQAHQEVPAKMVNQETKAKLVIQANKVKRVCAPNIALSMVVSSSKMVRVVKHAFPFENISHPKIEFTFMTKHYCSHAGFSCTAILVFTIVTKKIV